MNRKYAEAMWPIMKAFSEGSDIQAQNVAGHWVDISPDDISDPQVVKWRVKPEPFETWARVREVIE